MTTDDGREFLLRMRAEGRTNDEIRDSLRMSGWAEADIDALFAPTPAVDPEASTSGTGAPAPAWVSDMGWSWGAFFFGWIWGIANRVWIALLALAGFIPYVGWLFVLGFKIWLGINGHSLAWRHRRFTSTDQFRSTMRAWNIAGLVASIITLAACVAVFAAVVIPVFVRAHDFALQESCRGNEMQIALGVLMYAQDHKGMLPSSSAIRQDIQPYTKNSALWQCPSGNGDTYALNPTLSGTNLSAVAHPAQAVLLYEVNSAGQPILPHHDGANFAYADGLAKWLTGSSAKAALSQMGLAPPAAAPKTSAG